MPEQSKSSSASTDETPPFLGGCWAIALGVTMLAGFSVIAVLSAMDRERRGSIEGWEQATGVEDKDYFSMPAKLDAASSLAVRLNDDTPLYLVSLETVGIHDSDVRRVSLDPGTNLTVYRSADPKSADPGDMYLLKIEPGRYARVRDTRK